MIAPILEFLRPEILALPWVEQYGGMVRTVSRPQMLNIDDVPQIIMQSFPVSCDVSAADCWNNERYKDLVPNDVYKSVSYFEERGGMRLDGISAVNGLLEFSANVSFVAWLNMKKLGYDTCHFADYVAATMFPFLRKKNVPVTAPFKCLVSVEPINFEARGADIFEGYAYQDEQALLFYPYDYFAINCMVKIQLDPKCLPEYVVETPIIC